MANASKKHMGSGTQGKSAGVGANTVMPKDMVQENMILSNRDKSQHSAARGLDSKRIQSDQHQDHAANRLPDDEE